MRLDPAAVPCYSHVETSLDSATCMVDALIRNSMRPRVHSDNNIYQAVLHTGRPAHALLPSGRKLFFFAHFDFARVRGPLAFRATRCFGRERKNVRFVSNNEISHGGNKWQREKKEKMFEISAKKKTTQMLVR